MLADFIGANREEILTRCRAKAAVTSPHLPLDAASEYTAVVFLDELLSALRFGSHLDTADGSTVHHRDDDFLEERLSVPRAAQYGDVCRSITELAMEMNAPIHVTEFASLDRCLDEATARAVTEFAVEGGQTAHAVPSDSERLRVSQHELRKLVNTAILSFDVLRTGKVGLEGSTGALLHRSLIELRTLLDQGDGNAD